MDFWETTSGLFSYSATLSSTVDPCGLPSTAPCTWQFVQCCCLRSACVDSSGRRLPYSSLVGSTVDTCFRQSLGDTTGAVPWTRL